MVISRKQFGIMALIAMITFKISMLPGLIYKGVGTTTWLLIIMYSVVELLLFLLIYRIVDKGYTEDFEEVTSSFSLKCLMLCFYIFFMLKILVYSAELLTFIQYYFFINLDGLLAIGLLGIPIVYLAIKGYNTIGRTAELFFALIIACYVFNAIFFKTNTYFENNFPFMDDGYLDFFKNSHKYFIYFGDATPFMFMTLAEKKERNVVPWFLLVGFFAVIGFNVLAVGVYGEALVGINNFVVRLGSFNDFSQNLGRMDWTGIIAWFLSGIIHLSIIYCALLKSATKIVNRPRLVAVVTYFLVFIILKDGIKNQPEMTRMALEYFGYVSMAISILVPTWVVVKLKFKRKYAKTLSE